MTPWVVDAKDIAVESVAKFKQSLFHSNAQITRFLDVDAKNEVLVVGPKGFGKTLLLMVKRKALEGHGYQLFPDNALLDKPIGTPHIFAYKDYADLLNSRDYWRHVWLISLTMASLKFLKTSVKFLSPQLTAVYENAHVFSCCDIFDRVLSLSRQEYYLAYNDLRTTLTPMFRLVHTPLAMFIDNVDEYFEQAISVGESSAVPVDFRGGAQEANRSFWHLAQVGLASAARELNGLNNHVKVCVSLRREVFQSLQSTDSMATQLSGSAIQVKYDLDDLREILRKNLHEEKARNMVAPHLRDPVARFFGNDGLYITHSYTNEEETVEEFLLRHTLWRPRDVAFLGHSLSEIDPKRRTNNKVREIINSAASTLAKNYIAECKPHISSLDESILYPRIPSNVLDRTEISRISAEYDKTYKERFGVELPSSHVISQLHRLGLLGWSSAIDGRACSNRLSPA